MKDMQWQHTKMVTPPLTFLAISSLSWASDACSLSLSWSSNLCSMQLLLCDHTAVQGEDGMVKLCTEVFQRVSVFATPLVPTSSPPPPSSPVISVRDAVYEYEAVGTLHSQTQADTQDTAEHQTIRQ